MGIRLEGIECVLQEAIKQTVSTAFSGAFAETICKAISDFLDDLILLDTAQTANLLNVSVCTVRFFRNSGDLPWVDCGKKAPRYRLSDIRQFIERRKKQNLSPDEWAKLRQQYLPTNIGDKE